MKIRTKLAQLILLVGAVIVLPGSTEPVRACSPYCCVADCGGAYCECIEECSLQYGYGTPGFDECLNQICNPAYWACGNQCCNTSC